MWRKEGRGAATVWRKAGRGAVTLWRKGREEPRKRSIDVLKERERRGRGRIKDQGGERKDERGGRP